MSNYAFTHEGRSFTPDGAIEAPIDTEAHNKAVEASEIEWLKSGPDKVFLYVKLPDTYHSRSYVERKRVQTFTIHDPIPPQINTWLGTAVATHIWIGPSHDIGFGHHSNRRPVSCRIYGVQYHGWYFESSGDYCRLKKARRQS